MTKIPIFNSPPPHCVYFIERPLPIFLPCSSAINLLTVPQRMALLPPKAHRLEVPRSAAGRRRPVQAQARQWARSEEHTSELQSLMRISYAVFCLKTKTETKPLHCKNRHRPCPTIPWWHFLDIRSEKH